MHVLQHTGGVPLTDSEGSPLVDPNLLGQYSKTKGFIHKGSHKPTQRCL